jgi:hypothetical protein
MKKAGFRFVRAFLTTLSSCSDCGRLPILAAARDYEMRVSQ